MPWASSTMTAASCVRAASTICGSGAMSPSIEKTPSTTISRPRAETSVLICLRKVRCVVVLELPDVAEREARAVDDARVVLLVEIDDVALADETGDRAQVHLEAGGEGDGRVLAHEVGEPLLEPHVDIEGAVQEPRAGAARSVFPDGGDRRLLHPGVVGQPEVVVRAEHDHPPAVADDLGILRGLDHAEEGVHPRLADAFRNLVAMAFLEEGRATHLFLRCRSDLAHGSSHLARLMSAGS